MQTFTVLKSLPYARVGVVAHPLTKRALHAAPILRRQARAQAQGEEGNKGEGTDVPVPREQQGAITSSPLSIFPSPTFPMPGRLGSIFREIEEEMNAMTRYDGDFIKGLGFKGWIDASRSQCSTLLAMAYLPTGPLACPPLTPL